jgi:hypothetical protein
MWLMLFIAASTHLEEDGDDHHDAVRDVPLAGAPALLELNDREFYF